jgi:uncharacterized membrane protein
MSYIFFSLLGALLLSLSDLFSKYALNNGISNINYIFWSHGITYFVCLILLLLLTYGLSITFLTNNSRMSSLYDIVKLNKNRKVNIATICSGVCGFMALLVIIYSFSISENIGYNSAIISSACLFTLIFSILFLKASIEFKGILGCIFIIVGLILISRCSNSLHQ